MGYFLFAWVLGIISALYWPMGDNWLLLIVAVLGSVGYWVSAKPGFLLLVTAVAGLSWAQLSIQQTLADQLAADFDGRTLWLEGVVSGLPSTVAAGKQSMTRFELLQAQSRRGPLPQKLRLAWYSAPELEPGQRWRLAVSLKAPYGLKNAGLFDYEKWLFAQGIGATGTVKQGQLLGQQTNYHRWRLKVQQALKAHLSAAHSDAVLALIVGDGAALSREQWSTLRATGTIHLMVISGQHISLVAGLVYGLLFTLGRLGYWPSARLGLGLACALTALAILCYAALAGFGVPVQRACIMTFSVLIWRWRYQQIAVYLPLLLALALVAGLDPLVIYQSGFWLSFVAVASLAWCFSYRLRLAGAWRGLIQAQLIVSLGLFVVLISQGLPQSLVSPVANLLAIPAVSLWILPLALIATGLMLLGLPALAEPLLQLAQLSLDQLLLGLAFLARWELLWSAPLIAYRPLLLSLIALAALALLAPRGLFVKSGLSLVWLPMLVNQAPSVPAATLKVTVMDVGQGQAILLQTQHRAMLYDAGPALGGANLGETVVLPSLQLRGVRALDLLLISHQDLDHSGGAGVLKQHLPITRVINGEPQRGEAPCRAQQWEWDQVQFAIWQAPGATSSNARSCILLVKTGGQRLLILGDAGVKEERLWLQAHPQTQVDWLVLGHHGSKTSSAPAFLQAIQVENVIISRGKYNAYNHPHPDVKKTLEQLQVKVYDTALHGAVEIYLADGAQVKHRMLNPPIWSARLQTLAKVSQSQ